jgi:hypothetical protein
MVHDSIRGDRADGVMPSLMTTHEVAAWLKTTISAVYAKAERGTLPGAVRLGRRLYKVACRSREAPVAACKIEHRLRGAALKAVQDLAGHSTLTMTLRYMHLAPSALREAIGLLDDFGQQMGNAAQAAS